MYACGFHIEQHPTNPAHACALSMRKLTYSKCLQTMLILEVMSTDYYTAHIHQLLILIIHSFTYSGLCLNQHLSKANF